MNRLLALAILTATAAPVAALAQTAAVEGEAGDRVAPAPETEEVGVTSYVTEQPDGAVFASDLVGQPVYGTEGETVGDINDVLIGGDGRVEGVVIGVGGFLGLGEKDVAVPLSDLEFSVVDGRQRVTLSASERELLEAPVFSRADGSTSDRLGSFERMYERTREQAGELYDRAAEEAGTLSRQAGEEAQRLLEQGQEALRQLTGEPAPPADGRPAEGGEGQGGGAN